MTDQSEWSAFQGIDSKVRERLVQHGFTKPTQVQTEVIKAYKQYKDFVIASQTGSGKTLAFGIPIISDMIKNLKYHQDRAQQGFISVLILTPTRELAMQIMKHLKPIIEKDLYIGCLIGGMSKQKQIRILNQKLSILIATPGRLWEFIDQEKVSCLKNINHIEFLIVDEADRMVELGHYEDLDKIIDKIAIHQKVYVDQEVEDLMKTTSAKFSFSDKNQSMLYEMEPDDLVEMDFEKFNQMQLGGKNDKETNGNNKQVDKKNQKKTNPKQIMLDVMNNEKKTKRTNIKFDDEKDLFNDEEEEYQDQAQYQDQDQEDEIDDEDYEQNDYDEENDDDIYENEVDDEDEDQQEEEQEEEDQYNYDQEVDNQDQQEQEGEQQYEDQGDNYYKDNEESRSVLRTFLVSATLTQTFEKGSKFKFYREKGKKNKEVLEMVPKLQSLIGKLNIQTKPKVVDLTSSYMFPQQLTHLYSYLDEDDKLLYVVNYINEKKDQTFIIFLNSITYAKKLSSLLGVLDVSIIFIKNKLKSVCLHSLQQQRQRLKRLDKFVNRTTKILICTDVAARGLDIPNVENVIHYQIPFTVDTFIHRCGRTARIGNEGNTLSLIGPKDIVRFHKLENDILKGGVVMNKYQISYMDRENSKLIIQQAQLFEKEKHSLDKNIRLKDGLSSQLRNLDYDLDDQEIKKEIEQVEEEIVSKRRILNQKQQQYKAVVAQKSQPNHKQFNRNRRNALFLTPDQIKTLQHQMSAVSEKQMEEKKVQVNKKNKLKKKVAKKLQKQNQY